MVEPVILFLRSDGTRRSGAITGIWDAISSTRNFSYDAASQGWIFAEATGRLRQSKDMVLVTKP